MAKTKPPVILLTGFDPFGGESTNPSWEAVRQLRGQTIRRHRVEVARLPTVFGAAEQALALALRKHAPRLVLCVGQAGGRATVSIERVAINLVDARIADNLGAQPLERAVVAGGPAAYLSALPVKAMVAALRDAGIPAEVSLSAGSFVCNAVFYALCHYIATEDAQLRGGFVHIPFAPEQAAARAQTPSMAVEQVVAALRIAARVALSRRRDVSAGEGKLS
jgi:pyroglutamyl-peptidase